MFLSEHHFKVLQNDLREAAFDEKYGDFEEEEEIQQENPEGNKDYYRTPSGEF